MLTPEIYEVAVAKFGLNSMTFSINGGNFTSERLSFTVAVQDSDKNGLFNEVGEDVLLVGESGVDSMDITAGISSAQLQNDNYIQAGSSFFKVSFIDPQGQFLVLEKSRSTVQPTVRLFERIPDENFQLVSGGRANLRDYARKGKYVYVDIWGTWCAPCVAAIPKLRDIYSKYASKLTIIALNYRDGNKSKVAEFIKENGMEEWTNGYSTSIINSEILQNGFPYGVLFDKEGKVIKMDIDVNELDRILSERP
ncbi:MAG: TlpA family protein disulfide reductase [Bacteroidota bacterium]